MFDGPIRDHAHWTPRAPAIITPSRTLSYAQFNADIDRFGMALGGLGIDHTTGVVSIDVEDPVLTYVLLAALARLRIPTSPYNDPGADVRLVQEHGNAGTGGPTPPLITLTRDWVATAQAAPPTALPILEIDPEAIGRVMLSSGTTQTPRRVAMTWKRIRAASLTYSYGQSAGLHGTWVPLTTIESLQGYNMATTAWSQGASLSGGTGALELPATMENHSAGLIGCTPVQLQSILGHLPSGFVPLPGWRICVVGARLPSGLAHQARLRLTTDIWITYGATEASTLAIGPVTWLDDDPGIVGFPPSGMVLEMVGDDGQPLPDGQSGELRARGDRVADGYLNDPEASTDRFRDGWFYTRDIGYRRPDGRIVLEGRVDDRMILADVGKFMPAFLEDAALACPGVRDVAAFAVPSQGGLDDCWLAIVADPDFERDNLPVHLATYPGLPTNRFAWIDEIPRNAMGKVERTKLRDALIAALAQG